MLEPFDRKFKVNDSLCLRSYHTVMHDDIKDPIIRYFIFIMLNNDNMKYLGQTMR